MCTKSCKEGFAFATDSRCYVARTVVFVDGLSSLIWRIFVVNDMDMLRLTRFVNIDNTTTTRRSNFFLFRQKLFTR